MAPVSEIESSRANFNSTLHSFNKDEITISEYIFLRIYQLGIKSIFGVPGDFNLSLLEHLYDIPDLNWIGCCNELNASYAADAYSKTTNKMSVLLTTYGVGELSAINGIAGSYSEYSPLLHIVGTSRYALKNSDLNIHHLVTNSNTLLKPDHFIYEKIAENFSCVQESITDDALEACVKVDNVIRDVWMKSRPGYLFLPCDLTEMKVPMKYLYTDLDLTYSPTVPQSRIDEVVSKILDKLYSSSNPCVIADYFLKKFRLEDKFEQLINKLDGKINIYDTFLGKGLIHEDMSRFVGTYNGKLGDSYVTKSIESSDLILHIGNFDNEVNNGFFTFDLLKERKIELNPDYISICGELYTDLNLQDVFPVLLSKLQTFKVPTAKVIEKDLCVTKKNDTVYPLIEQDLFNSLQSNLKPNDILIVDTCSFIFSISDLKLKGAKFINQMLWGAIGYALPATLGASLALRDFNMDGRVITVEGDGSAQMSLQELASFVRYKINPILFILNNDGYTIERVIKGPNRSYNDISCDWQWCQMMKVFGDVDETYSKSHRVTSAKQLETMMSDTVYQHENKFQLVELILPKFDVPDRLLRMIHGN
ncbi:hypothetical protein CANARDRAFT_6971 [[Candida] arabinofermentans NRRL YB-2248]|uniref:Pyruvate decarboxylase n=1 Tax=[Candida] arabinofermentans NRRL YB-2248 TaxID=983967 RepID=A0A1E4T419_9ASCO|nr:hypothetical protein CANARDRAFT_6971 [[Candida] arabinofermentans NRRL YB-2248]